MREEIMKILGMVEAGRVNAAQAGELMEAMGVFEMRLPEMAGEGRVRQLCIYVDSAEGDQVRVRVPAAMIKAGLSVANGISVGGQEALKNIDMAAVMEAADQMLDAGGTGELVTVHSGEGDRVLIRLE